MSDVLQIKAGQRGKVLQFLAGIDLTAASTIKVRVRSEDETLNEYAAVVSTTDPTALELAIASGMFDTAGVYSVDYVVVMPDGRVLSPDDNIAIEVVEV